MTTITPTPPASPAGSFRMSSTKPPRRTRKGTQQPPKDWQPKVETLTLDGRAALAVELYGPHAAGACMILDSEEWHAIAERWGQHWYLHDKGGGRPYVGCFRKAARSGLNSSAVRKSAFAALARLLLQPPAGHAVLHLNGNPLDLRRANLSAVSTTERCRAAVTARWRRSKQGVH